MGKDEKPQKPQRRKSLELQLDNPSRDTGDLDIEDEMRDLSGGLLQLGGTAPLRNPINTNKTLLQYLDVGGSSSHSASLSSASYLKEYSQPSRKSSDKRHWATGAVSSFGDLQEYSSPKEGADLRAIDRATRQVIANASLSALSPVPPGKESSRRRSTLRRSSSKGSVCSSNSSSSRTLPTIGEFEQMDVQSIDSDLLALKNSLQWQQRRHRSTGNLYRHKKSSFKRGSTMTQSTNSLEELHEYSSSRSSRDGQQQNQRFDSIPTRVLPFGSAARTGIEGTFARVGMPNSFVSLNDALGVDHHRASAWSLSGPSLDFVPRAIIKVADDDEKLSISATMKKQEDPQHDQKKLMEGNKRLPKIPSHLLSLPGKSEGLIEWLSSSSIDQPAAK